MIRIDLAGETGGKFRFVFSFLKAPSAHERGIDIPARLDGVRLLI